METNTTVGWIAAILIVAICAVFGLGIYQIHCNKLTRMAQAGYCEVQRTGSLELMWQKCK